ncbi:MAG: tetratricopeptide repeat protein, partial [Planctomycetota bacterium]|nr:tetratricopeptide repeat protein [Planctomycetota bacterium]
LTFAVYWPIVHHDFVEFDDDKVIRDNASFHPVTWEKLVRYWRGPYYGGAFPITHTTLGAIAAIARDGEGVMQPRPFHVASLLLHASGVVVVFFTVRRLTEHEWAAALGAAYFAVHPLQVESVAWATNINSLLQGLLSLLAINLYVAHAQRDAAGQRDARQRLLFVAATVSYLLAMGSKPVAVTLPLVVLALDVGWIGRSVRRAIVPVGVWLVFAVPVVFVTRRMLTAPDVYVPPLWARPLVALDAITFYMGKIVLPLGPSPDYGRSPRWLMGNAALYATWIVPVLAAITIWMLRKRAPKLLPAALVVALPLLPVLGLTPFHQQQYSTVTDRYMYLPLLGISAAGAWVASQRFRSTAIYALAAWVAVLAVWSRAEVGKWRDTETLFRTVVARNPTSLPGHTVLGLLAVQRNQRDVALAEYRAALQTDPGFPPTLYNLGNVLLAQRRFDEAISTYRTALLRDAGNPRYLSNLGVAQAEAGHPLDAEESFLAALRTDPNHVDALIGRGVVNRQLGRFDASLRSFERALMVNPSSPLARRGVEQTRAAMVAPTTVPARSGGPR